MNFTKDSVTNITDSYGHDVIVTENQVRIISVLLLYAIFMYMFTSFVYTFTKLHDRRIPTMYPNPDS